MTGDDIDVDNRSTPKGEAELTQDLSPRSIKNEENFEGFQEPQAHIPEGTAAIETGVAGHSDQMADALQIDEDHDLDGMDI